jgi:hypothetical protein
VKPEKMFHPTTAIRNIIVNTPIDVTVGFEKRSGKTVRNTNSAPTPPHLTPPGRS